MKLRQLVKTVGEVPLVLCLKVDVELNELDGAVVGDLADYGEPRHDHPGGDEDPVVRTAGDQLGEIIEPSREPVDDVDQFEDLEVIG